MNMRGVQKIGWMAAAAVMAALLAPAAVQGQAATCMVTSTSDSGPGTLRAHLANADCAVIAYDGVVLHGSVVSTPLLVNRDVTIKGPWSLPDAYLYPGRFAIVGFGSRVFEVSASAHVVITGLGFSGTEAPFGGGVILNRGTLTVSDSEFASNQVTPANDPEFGVERSVGGAIYNIGTLTVTRSLFRVNTASEGAAIYNRGSLTVISSSFLYNHDHAIFNVGDLTLTSSTIAQNGGVGLWQSTGSLRSKNNIVAGNSGGDCENIEGALSIHGVNFATDGTCPQFQQVTIGDLRFAALPATADLLDGSVAIDAATDCTLHDGVTPVGSDERGFARPQGAACDAGSFEFVAPFTFTGFFAPLHNQALNAVKAGRTVAVNFSLGGGRGLGVLAPGFPASQEVECDRSSDTSVVDETVAPGGSGLSYDVATDTYTYLWQTQTNWASSCRDLTLRFVDGSSEQVRFRFHK